jgi:riboflavin synthase
MFTGIVEEQGAVAGLKKDKNLFVLRIDARKIVKGLKAGDSVAVNGVCLTVTTVAKKVLSFDLMKETIAATTLKNLQRGGKVNLERALRVGDRFGGHFVTGHVDGMGQIRKIIRGPNYVEWQLTTPAKLLKYIVPKGSVALEGVSLTVGAVGKSHFSVYLIPYTLKRTTLGLKQEGDGVNLETDILAKFVFTKNLLL